MFHIRCVQKIQRISFRDCIPHVEIRSRAGVNSVETYIIRQELFWTGHITRMPESRLPRITLYSELQEGSRNRGDQRKSNKDHKKKNLSTCTIASSRQETLVSDRVGWRRLCNEVVQRREQHRITEQANQRQVASSLTIVARSGLGFSDLASDSQPTCAEAAVIASTCHPKQVSKISHTQHLKLRDRTDWVSKLIVLINLHRLPVRITLVGLNIEMSGFMQVKCFGCQGWSVLRTRSGETYASQRSPPELSLVSVVSALCRRNRLRNGDCRLSTHYISSSLRWSMVPN